MRGRGRDLKEILESLVSVPPDVKQVQANEGEAGGIHVVLVFELVAVVENDGVSDLGGKGLGGGTNDQ